MTTRALPLAPIAPAVRVECSPLKATISARQCLAVQKRTERRPFACAGCPIGDAVRAGAGDAGPAPVAFEPVAAEPEPVRLVLHGESKLPRERPHRSHASLTARVLAEAARLLHSLRVGHATSAGIAAAVGLSVGIVSRARAGDLTLATLVALRDAHNRLRRCGTCACVLPWTQAGATTCAGCVGEPSWLQWAARRPKRGST